MSGIRGVVAVLVAVLAVASGCTRSGTGAEEASTIDILATAGIAVFAQPEDTEPLVTPAEPVSPVRLLEWQVENLEAQGGGLTAAQLDAAVPGVEIGEHAIPTSALVSAWAEEFDTAAAAHAREVLAGPPDWPEEVPADARPVYSDLVLLLFASDVATVGASLPEQLEEGGDGEDSDGGQGGEAAFQDIGRACQTVVGFTANVRAAVTNALNRLVLNPPPVNTGFGPFDTLINTVVQGAAGLFNLTVKAGQILVDGVFQATVGQVLGFVARIAGVVGTLAKVKNFVQPWTLTLHEKDPQENQLGVRPAQLGPPGTVTARVTGRFDKWPPWLEQCAQSVGRPLPDLKPSGSKLEWKFNGFDRTAPTALGVMDEERTERTLAPGGTARLAYHTGVEDPPAPDAEDGAGLVLLSVHIERDDISKLQDLLNNLVNDAVSGALPLGGVPFARELVARTATKLLSGITSGVTAALAKVARTYDANGFVVVRYHKPGDDDTPNPPGTTDPGDQRAIPDVCDLLADEEIARVLGYQVGYANSTRETRETATAQGLPVRPSFQWSESCEKSTADYEDYWATPPGSRIGLPPEVGWTVMAYTDDSDARDNLAEVISTREKAAEYASLPGYTRLDGLGDEAIVDPGVAAPPYLVVRVDNYVVLVNKAFKEDSGLPSSPDTFVEIGRIIAGRL